MIAYKLFRQRKDGSLGSLFINTKLKIPVGEWVEAETGIVKKGYMYRPGWHFTFEPFAPHLLTKPKNENRVWCEIEVPDNQYIMYNVPKNQGGKWGITTKIKIIKVLNE